MAATKPRTTYLTGSEREAIAAHLRQRYEAGESIREIASSLGRAYNGVHRILKQSGVKFRPRGGDVGHYEES